MLDLESGLAVSFVCASTRPSSGGDTIVALAAKLSVRNAVALFGFLERKLNAARISPQVTKQVFDCAYTALDYIHSTRE